MVDDIPDERNIGTAVNEWDSGIGFGPRSNTYKLVRALLSEADRIDDDLEKVYDEHHINSADGESLDKFGALVNAPRKDGESDNKYRTRIKAEYAKARTDTDFDSFIQFVSAILDTGTENFDLLTGYDQNSATVTVSADPSLYDEINLTVNEITDILGGGVPAGHEVIVQERGTFRLKSDGDFDTAENGLTADNIETGGTLAADVV
jgi:hypothetical protein